MANGSLKGNGNETVIWHDGGLTPPMPHLLGDTNSQGHLWKLLTSGEPIKTWIGNMSINISNTVAPISINLHINATRYIQACVKIPYVILSGDITWNSSTGVLTCSSNCTLQHCVNFTWWKTSSQTRDSLYLVKVRPKIWLPVNLTQPWSESVGVMQIYNALTELTHRVKRMIGLIIATVIGLVAVASTAAVAGVALQQEIQTADFVRGWHKDSHLLWQQQHDIDAQIAEDIANLQQTVLWMGDQVSVLATRVMLRCDWNTSYFCITPVPYNVSKDWKNIRNLLIGHKNVSLESQLLEYQIGETFIRQLPKLIGNEIFSGNW
ncbi:endogenous retrovirus group K member 7 Env polyprotein [Echinops telfairi]|uniref:Endogenous retrovirus group K member 7 Env polyprotein n=1 Tax=Echinops telfairi TaxID=9371 RepID=A0AC55DSR8_ECHTE|nr:endogenous retrovirus group K member 7 Env polyprotein [Echinops telfairi]